MPEQAFTPPETKYEVHIDELMKAIRRSPFEQGKGLWRMKGKDIINKLKREASFSINREQEYVLLGEALLLTSKETIALQSRTFIDYGVGFVFYNSIIQDIDLSGAKIAGLYFWNCQLGDIRISDRSQSGDISIYRNSQSGCISIDGNSQSANISIGSNSQIAYIKINSSSQSNDIQISDNSQSGEIIIDRNSQSGDIRISDRSQSGIILISESSQSGDIRISGRSQSGDIRIFSNTKPFGIFVKEESQIKKLWFNNAVLTQVLVSDCCFDLSLYNTQFLLFIISNCLVSSLNWRVGTRGELHISQSRVLHLQVANTTLLKDSVLSLSDTALRYGVLNEVLVQGSLLLRKLDPPGQPFEWRDINAYLDEEPTDEWKKELWNSKKKLLEGQKKEYDNKVAELEAQYGASPLFRISHSSLGKTEITGSNLAGFCFQYYNSKLLDCFITGTELPKSNIEIYNPNPDKPLSDHEVYTQKTAVYNQFKKIYENQGDVVEASEFHAQAMRWQQKLLWYNLRHGENGFWKKVKLFFENVGFRLNWMSNNHGESWFIALLFTMGVSLLFFTASMWALKYDFDIKLVFSSKGYRFLTDFGLVREYGERFFGFLNPTHSFDYLSKDTGFAPDFGHSCWDFLGRIFIGYGFFQFIAAFRRHGKKSG